VVGPVRGVGRRRRRPGRPPVRRLSINVERILALPGVPARAAEAIVVLPGVLVVSVLCLAPGTGRETLGWLLLVESIALLLVVAALAVRSARPGEGRPPSRVAGSLAFSAAGTLPFLVGAISLVAGSGGGLYWTLGGVIAAFVGAVLNAWVFLIEILR
jgi:modulator of FtsH protease